MTENKHIGKIIYALVAVALIAVMLVSCAARGVFGLDRTGIGAKIKSAAEDDGIGQEYESKLFDTSSVMTVDIIMDDDKWQSTNFFDILLENEEYSAKYHEYLSMLVDYVENGGYEKLTQRLHSQIDELVETDPTSFYTYDEYKAAYTMLDEVVHLRAESIKGQLDKTIPSTSEGQKEDASSLIDASAIDTSVMGRMGMGNNDNGKKEEPVQSSSSTENSR